MTDQLRENADGASKMPAGKEQEGVEYIRQGEQLLSIVVRSNFSPAKTSFFTEDELEQQAGFIVYPAGGTIASHEHRPLHREISSTSETLIVRSGSMEAQLFDDSRQLVATRTLAEGDVLILISGSHGFRMNEDTVLLEIKQGPYSGLDEKIVWG
ncbi:MAG: hypothetical protein IH953_01150 [Chloroflexi bacterium]|nr:hypothetical protein [Chloroflexota bacterium]